MSVCYGHKGVEVEIVTTKISIIGLGLIGTSIGLALRSAKPKELEIVGHDREPTAGRGAKGRGALNSLEWNLFKCIDGADMVIIATPALAIKEVMEQIGPHLPEDCVVTDTGSTKKQVLQWAKDVLPANVHFVGGHPMAGKEESGHEAADAALFKDATYCVLPSLQAPKWAVEAVISMVDMIGAKPYFIDPQEHDSYVAAVSHLPMALSAALVASTAQSPSWSEMARLAASGYRDVSRLASGDPEMNRDICITNSEEIAAWIDRAVLKLLELKRHLTEGDEEGVARMFAGVFEEREKLMAGAVQPVGSSPDMPSVGDNMRSMFVGDLLARKGRLLMERYDTDPPGKNNKNKRR